MDRLSDNQARLLVGSTSPLCATLGLKLKRRIAQRKLGAGRPGAGASKYRPYFSHCRYETQDFCQYQGDLVKYLEPIYYVCEITTIPLPAQSLDAILCTEVIEHVIDPWPR